MCPFRHRYFHTNICSLFFIVNLDVNIILLSYFHSQTVFDLLHSGVPYVAPPSYIAPLKSATILTVFGPWPSHHGPWLRLKISALIVLTRLSKSLAIFLPIRFLGGVSYGCLQCYPHNNCPEALVFIAYERPAP